jgi:hypothetical protein
MRATSVRMSRLTAGTVASPQIRDWRPTVVVQLGTARTTNRLLAAMSDAFFAMALMLRSENEIAQALSNTHFLWKNVSPKKQTDCERKPKGRTDSQVKVSIEIYDAVRLGSTTFHCLTH